MKNFEIVTKKADSKPLKIFRNSPENPELCTTLGLMYMQTGQHQLAFEQLGTAMAFDPNCTRAIMAAGSMMQSHHDYDVALVSSPDVTLLLISSRKL
jgi:Tfp pilus assembly protein PilF